MADISAQYRALVNEIMQLEAARLKREGFQPRPLRPPASDAAIADVEKKLGRKLPESYVALLRAFDGWEDLVFTSIYGTEELRGEAYEGAKYSFRDTVHSCEQAGDTLPRELRNGFIIGEASCGSNALLLLESGEVVDFSIREEGRYGSLEAYLHSLKRELILLDESASAARAATEKEWDAECRAGSDRALELELEQALAAYAQPPQGAQQIRAKEPFPKAVAPRELVLKDENEVVAEVGLGLVLYLGAAPTREEVVATFRAFRRHFPLQGLRQWRPAGMHLPHPAKHPDDESFADALAVDDEGHFGLCIDLTLGKKQADEPAFLPVSGGDGAFLNVQGVPPGMAEDADGQTVNQARASFVDLFLPARTSPAPAALEALCRELLDLLPVRSGHGGFFIYVRPDDDDDRNLRIFRWCQRFWGLEPLDITGWLTGTLRRLRGANWLTVLGMPFANVLDRANAWQGAPAQVKRFQGKHGVLLRAGEEPSLCDVARGELPAELTFVARAIDPLLVGGYAKMENVWISYNHFVQTSDEMQPFVHHHATREHLRRLANPDGFLGPTPFEQAEAFLKKLSAQGKMEAGTNPYKEWLRAKKEGHDNFRDLLGALFSATCVAQQTETELGIKALELAARYPGWAPAQVYNNLLWAYDRAKRYEDALVFMSDALRTAKENPSTYHNAACILGHLGRLDDAMKCVQLAKEHGYHDFARMKDDKDLAPIADRPEFKALFA